MIIISAILIGIQLGANTHHQLQLMQPVSFSPMNSIVSITIKLTSFDADSSILDFLKCKIKKKGNEVSPIP